MDQNRIYRVMCVLLLLALILTACGGSDDDKTGEKQSYKVGILVSNAFDFVVSNPLQIELEKLGYVEGENIEYLVLLAETPDQMDAAIEELVAADVDVIYTSNASVAYDVIERTSTTPVVFASGFDETVAPLRGPQSEGALVTGITLGDATTRRLDFLLKIDPSIQTVYVPYDPTNDMSAAGFALLSEVAPRLDVAIIGIETTDVATSQQAAEAMPEDVDAIFLWTERFAVETWGIWTELALERRIPTSLNIANIELLDFVMGYGPDFDVSGGKSAHIVDRVLRGDPANEIPFEPCDPHLGINLAVADQIGLEISDTILAQATVIEYDTNGTGPTLAAAEDEPGACITVLQSPLGSTTACVDVGCAGLVDTTLITFEDKQDAEECTPEGVIGVCVAQDVSIYFYEGELGVLSGGCTVSGGTWTTLAEPEEGASDSTSADAEDNASAANGAGGN